MVAAKAVVNGAVSIVNAIATGKGAALGISLKVEAIVDVKPGSGIFFKNQIPNQRRFINKVVEKAVPKK